MKLTDFMMNETFEQLLKTEIYNNTVADYLQTLAVIVVFMIVLYVAKSYGVRKLADLAKHTKTNLGDRLVSFVGRISFAAYLIVASYFVLGAYLTLPEGFYKILKILLIVILTHEILKFLTAFVDLVVDQYPVNSKSKAQNKTLKQGIKLMAVITVWIVAIILILSNLGMEISALVASLGIGGVAVALAAQGILGDLFSAFSIYLDRPFEVGDFIIVGEDMGTVTKIGLRTSRIQSLNGEEIVIGNQDLSKARLQNFHRMERRRVLIKLGLTYDAGSKKLKLAKKIITDIIKKNKDVELDRVHFSEFGESALMFEIVFYMLNSDYTSYMDTKEKINLKIMDEFESNEIKFAFPTRTIHMENNV